MDVDGVWDSDASFEVVESVGPNRFLFGSRDADENTTVRLMDGNGNVLGEHTFEWIERFIEGYARVYRRPRVADRAELSESNFIDMDGKLVSSQWV
jgi:hypothetical protein